MGVRFVTLKRPSTAIMSSIFCALRRKTERKQADRQRGIYLDGPLQLAKLPKSHTFTQ